MSIALLFAFGFNLVKEVKDEQFSTRDHTTTEPFDNLTKFGMVEMPSVLVYTNILQNASFVGVSVANSAPRVEYLRLNLYSRVHIYLWTFLSVAGIQRQAKDRLVLVWSRGISI